MRAPLSWKSRPDMPGGGGKDKSGVLPISWHSQEKLWIDGNTVQQHGAACVTRKLIHDVGEGAHLEDCLELFAHVAQRPLARSEALHHLRRLLLKVHVGGLSAREGGGRRCRRFICAWATSGTLAPSNAWSTYSSPRLHLLHEASNVTLPKHARDERARLELLKVFDVLT
eukprot:scaffold25714_cov30-Tisochrysis_lutea.AAC.8